VSGDLEAARALFVQATQRLLQEDYAGAELLLRQALDCAPGRSSIMGNLAAALIGQEKFADALDLSEQAIAADPNNAEAWLNLGRCLEADRDYPAALLAYDRALAIKPDYAEAWSSRGNVQTAVNHTDEALASYEKAVALRADFPAALANQAVLLNRLSRPAEALPKIQRALALKPDLAYGRSIRLQSRMALCDWTDFESDCAMIAQDIAAGRAAALPFSFLALPASAALQRQCAAHYAAKTFPAPATGSLAARHSAPRPRLRIGYFSADFHSHATAYLMAGLFEQHDRAGFEIFGFSFGPTSTDVMRQRLRAGMEHFIEVQDKSDAGIVAVARDLQLDIAIDLKGYTQGERARIFARRVAPVQASYLGYPGTMGASFIDYVIADAVTIPPAHFPHYSESVVHLPQSYQCTDSKRQISDRVFSRAECGLPDQGLVFCSFNNSYKITPDAFAVWMRLLRAVPGSVLWLLESGDGVAAMLRRAATQHGIAPERLVFAPKLPSPEHLARQPLADLFLDSFHYNAHTTASDALWAGLPVLTRIGNTFAGRVAASLLRAAGLPELVTQSTEDYEALALALSQDPARLRAIRQKLAAGRDTCALFDTPRFTRGLEAAYRAMWDRYQHGLSPAHIAINDVSLRNIVFS
jgi:protein O-GlcNAc transferase